MDYISTMMLIVFALMVVTNMITEVVKKLTWDKVPTNILVVLIAEFLTMISGAIYAEVTDVDILWYHVAVAIILGLFVSYAAMFGFDKFRQALEQITNKTK